MRFKSLTWLLVAGLIAGEIADAATLRLRFTAPTQDNSGTCIAPVLLAMGTNPNLKAHWRWWLAGGDSLGGAVQDSMLVAPGTFVAVDYPAPSGLYRVRAWMSDAGGAGCDTIATVSTFKYQPWKPRF